MSIRSRSASLSVFSSVLFAVPAFAGAASSPESAAEKGATLWQLVSAGGVSMVLLGVMSVATVALIIYHFLYVRPEKIVPQDLSENLLSLLERREYDKAVQVCRQQPSLISAIALKGLEKRGKGGAVVEEAIQFEGRARLERLWQNLTYLSDMAVIAPLLGLLGTIVGMIEAFGYFKVGSINPQVLTQGLAKAMINTAAGLIIAVPALAFYSYFRGRLGFITSTAEGLASEIAQVMAKDRS